MAAILEIGDFRTLFVVFVFCSSLLAVCIHNAIGNGRKDISLHVCPRWRADGSNILGREVSGRLNSHFWMRYVFQLCIQVSVSKWVLPQSKNLWSWSVVSLLSMPLLFIPVETKKKSAWGGLGLRLVKSLTAILCFQRCCQSFYLLSEHCCAMLYSRYLIQISIYCVFCFWSAGFALWCKSIFFYLRFL